MNPDSSSQGGSALGPSSPQSPQDNTETKNPQTAAVDVIRGQIDALYVDGGSSANNAAQSTVNQNPYQRNHTVNPQPQADQWKAYHSAWQDYYQKYYSAYYAGQALSQPTNQAHSWFQQEHQASHDNQSQPDDQEITKDEALFELRQKLLGRVKSQAGKIRRSRHFIPIIAALTVVLIFAFLQYNRVIIASVSAYVSPGAIDPQNIVIDPSTDISVGPESRLVIPKINVDVPAIYDVGADYDSQMAAMQNGVAHFSIPGADSHPGEVGNTVLSGHSSNDLFDPGDYKFIFAQLDKLVVGDTIYANYQSKRYTYVITKKEVVKPTDVGALIYPTKKPILTLITCTPLGTALNRLLITAEQVSPDPAEAAAAPKGSGQVGDETGVSIPGSSPTFLERLFGAH